MNARFLAAILVLAVLTVNLLAANPVLADEQSNHAAAFLRTGVDARYLAMGGTGTALANDVAAGYWNPAGLAMIRGLSATGMATHGLNFDRHHDYVALGYGMPRASVALSWINAGTSDIVGRDETGASTGSFNFSENAIILSGAVGAPTANIGASAKLLTQSLGTTAPGGTGVDDNTLGYAFDFGAQYLVTTFARVGFTLQDLFGHLGKEDADKVNAIPATARFGLALEPVEGLTIASDLVKVRDEEGLQFRIGGEMEVPLGNTASGAFRLGIRDGKFTGGVGFSLSRVSFDYAYVIEREAFLDENHRFSISIDLGGPKRTVTEGKASAKVADRDGDGFPDNVDKCPDQPEDFDSFQDFDGCPDLDNDNDGIPDVDDLCPDQPETKNGFQDDDGCPDTLQTQPSSIAPSSAPGSAPPVIPPARIPFASGKADIPAGSTAALDEVVRILKENPSLRLEVQGHTDNVGEDVLNMRLSLERAESVRQYLIEHGIAADRLVARGYGETRPTAGNATAGGRSANRRIEFVPLP